MKAFVSSAPPAGSRPATFRTIVPALAGIVAGVISSVIVHHQPAAANGPPAASPTAAAREPATTNWSAVASPSSGPLTLRLGAIEQKLARMTSKDDDAPSGRPDEIARHEQSRRLLASFDERLEKHERALTDAAWSKTASASLGSAMAAIAQRNHSQGELKAVDCRTDSCLATLEFPSFDAARDGYGDFVTAFYEVNCGRTSILAPPDHPDAPYTVKVIFESCRRD